MPYLKALPKPLLKALGALSAAVALMIDPLGAATAGAAAGSPATYYTATFKASTGNFLSAPFGGGGTVTAMEKQADAWGTLTLTDLDGGTLDSGDEIYLQASDGHYLSAQWGGGAPLDATRNHHLSWETFRISKAGKGRGGRVQDGAPARLRTTVTARYVAPADKGRLVQATLPKPTASSSFMVTLRPATGPATPPSPPATPAPSVPNSDPAATPAKSTAGSAAGPFVYPSPGGAKGPGVLPATPAKIDYLGKLKFDQPTALDLGFSGVLNGRSVWTFGDTLMPRDGDKYQFTASDSVGLGDKNNPLAMHQTDLNGFGWPDQWIPLNAQENANGGLGRYAMGVSNVVEYAPNKGLIWFVKNDRGTNGKGILGAGVATVTADPGDPAGATAVRTMDTIWGPGDPLWGDVGVAYNAGDKNVYVYGHGPGDPAKGLGTAIYLARVPAEKAKDISAYEYWDESAKSWTKQRATLNAENGTRKLTEGQAIFSHAYLGQSNPFWSAYYNTWMYVAGGGYPGSEAMVMTAPSPEGPWTRFTTVTSTCPTGTCGNLRYAITPHPEYDPSGKTLLITWTDENTIHASRITWK